MTMTRISPTNKRLNKLTVWKCKCDCGKIMYLRSNSNRQNCGCVKLSKPKKPTFDLTNQRFVHTVAKKYVGNSKWKCLCDCGNTHNATTGNLRFGNTTGCTKCPLTYKQGRLSKTPEYNAWKSMQHRCYNKKHPAYVSYGLSGIRVTKSWKIFSNFISDMGNRPGKGYSIDRIDNDGDYHKANCAWVTDLIQSNNQRGRTEKKLVAALVYEYHRGAISKQIVKKYFNARPRLKRLFKKMRADGKI